MAQLSIVRNVLGAQYNAAHYNHLHVDVYPKMTGTPPVVSGAPMTDGVRQLLDALEAEFGPSAYFTQATSQTKWTHMGWYNRRYIAGTTTWSQHAWGNALDIGPYYGVEEQKPFYDFLMGIEKEADMPDVGQNVGVDTVFAQVWQEMINEGIFSSHTDPDATPRNEQLAAFLARYTRAVVLDEINKAVSSGGLELDLEGKRLVLFVEDVA